LAVAIAGTVSGSPFRLVASDSWLYGNGTTSLSGWYGLLDVVAVYGGMLLLAQSWVQLCRVLRNRPGTRIMQVAAVVALWMTPLLLAAPLFSRDSYSYAAIGDMVTHHLDAYTYGPGVMGYNAFVPLVDPLWRYTPTPYGPLFLQLSGWLTTLAGHSVVGTLVLLRLAEVAGVAMIGYAAVSLAESHGRDRSLVLAVAVLNPVVLLHLVGGAHNDALMLGFMMLGLALAAKNRPVLGIVLCALGASVKIPAELGVVYIGWNWVGSNLSIRERVRPVLTALLISGAVLEAVSLFTGIGWGWIHDLGTPEAVQSYLSPVTGIGLMLGSLFRHLGLRALATPILVAARDAGLLAAALIGLFLLLNADRIGYLLAVAISMTVVTVLGPVIQPWYLAWGLVLVAPMANDRIRKPVFITSSVVAFAGFPGGDPFISGVLGAIPVWGLLIALAVIALPVSSVARRRAQTGSGAPARAAVS
jgi:alpha-1,6-mannosyltransferase